MATTYKTKVLPRFPIAGQLFHVPGAGIDGGFTSGGARIFSPDIGGVGSLIMQPSLQVREWDHPIMSWLMSQMNGQIFKIRLAATPQIMRAPSPSGEPVPWDGGILWDNDQPWAGDLFSEYTSAALEGTTTVTIDMTQYGQTLRPGHVIGHAFDCYLVDEIEYDGDIATVTVKPPLRRNIAAGDITLFRPYFTGQIATDQEFKTTYDAINNGAIKVGSITFAEVIL